MKFINKHAKLRWSRLIAISPAKLGTVQSSSLDLYQNPRLRWKRRSGIFLVDCETFGWRRSTGRR